jgi:hypothetical protein
VIGSIETASLVTMNETALKLFDIASSKFSPFEIPSRKIWANPFERTGNEKKIISTGEVLTKFLFQSLNNQKFWVFIRAVWLRQSNCIGGEIKSFYQY